MRSDSLLRSEQGSNNLQFDDADMEAGRETSTRHGRMSMADMQREMTMSPDHYELTSTGLRGWKIFKMLAAAEIVMFETLDNKEIHSRLAAQWGSIGIIAALLAGIAWSEITNVPDNIDPGLWTNLYGICAGAAAGGNILSSIVCMLFFMALNMGPEITSRAFIDYFLLLLPLPLVLLVVGFAGLLGAAFIQYKYRFADLFYPVIGLFGCFLFVGLFMFYYFVTGAQLVATGRHKVTVKANMV